MILCFYLKKFGVKQYLSIAVLVLVRFDGSTFGGFKLVSIFLPHLRKFGQEPYEQFPPNLLIISYNFVNKHARAGA